MIGIFKILDQDTNYWLVRTEGGIFYEQFVIGNYIAIGWNEISGLELFKKAYVDKDEVEKDKILKSIRETIDKEEEKETRPMGEREREAKKTRIYNQINRFLFEMKAGDYVLIPSPGSDLIEFGMIASEPYINLKKIVDVEENECDYLKRRDVKWLCHEKRNNLDPYLYGLIYSQHAISNANAYAHYIDRTIHKFYIKGNQAHLILEVGKETEIYGSHFIQMMSSVLDLVDSFNEIAGSNYDKNSVQVKINVQSPGPVEFFGQIEIILAIAASIEFIIGGKFSIFIFGQSLSFECPGIIEHIRKFVETRQNYLLEKEKIALQKMQLLQVKTPPELQPSIQERFTNKPNKN